MKNQNIIFFLSHDCYRLNSELIICRSWQFWHEEIVLDS